MFTSTSMVNCESLTGEQTWPFLHLSALHMPLCPHRQAAFSNSRLNSIQNETAESYIVTVDSGSGAWPRFRRQYGVMTKLVLRQSRCSTEALQWRA